MTKTKRTLVNLTLFVVALCCAAAVSHWLFHSPWYEEFGIVTVTYWLPQWLKTTLEPKR